MKEYSLETRLEHAAYFAAVQKDFIMEKLLNDALEAIREKDNAAYQNFYIEEGMGPHD